ncbi:MAG: hypothetical protein K9L80_01555 [Candidatus Omnitrophica bacterium]|nr:hypothetical protein [Candidatus Omnitrophota bacterium]MCF7887493.1 hypothetical protein [Candidatus Omnitrophota bacterium]MCF7888044.1 hypothetical protein [Candidatus Omnitrophota bacterium]
MLIKLKKAQSTLEYAALFAVVIGAIIAGQVYFKRGVQGKLKSSADQMGEQYSFGATGTTTQTMSSTSDETVGGGTTSTTSNQSQERKTDISVGEFGDEYWGE